MTLLSSVQTIYTVLLLALTLLDQSDTSGRQIQTADSVIDEAFLMARTTDRIERAVVQSDDPSRTIQNLVKNLDADLVLASADHPLAGSWNHQTHILQLNPVALL